MFDDDEELVVVSEKSSNETKLSDNSIEYSLTIINNKDQGLVFDYGSLAFRYNITGIDYKIIQGVIASIKQNKSLSAILSNRSDTTSGNQYIQSADAIVASEKSKTLNDVLKQQNNTDRLKTLDTQFASRIKEKNVTNYPSIPMEESFLPTTTEDVINSRYKLLTEKYTLLMNTIKNDKLIKIGKFNDNFVDTYDPNNYVGNVINISDKNKQQKITILVHFLFLVAKIFMRIPIVLLTMTTEESEITKEQNKIEPSNDQTELAKFNKCLKYYEELKKSIYHQDIQTNKIFRKITDVTKQQDNYKLIISNTQNNISIDIICYLLIAINTLNTNVNYDYMIIFVCERLIYIIDYWCSPPSVSTIESASSKLGELHNTMINTNYKNKFNGEDVIRTRSFASILQKLHNTNDNLLTFVKIRKGRITKDTSTGKTVNDGKTMNIRYAGFSENDPGKLTQDNTIFEFKYDDNPKSFYQDYDEVYENGFDKKPTILYKSVNVNTNLSVNTSYINKQQITTENLATSVDYKHDFNLGPFTYIFEEDKTNEKIAKSHIFVEKIVDKLITNGDPVSIIGYGSSGSGKTSVLIQLSAPNQPIQKGILMYLSDELGIKGYNNCKVQIIEFGNRGSDDKTKNNSDMSTFGKDGLNYPGPPKENAFTGEYNYGSNGWTTSTNIFFMSAEEHNTSGDMFGDILYFMEYQRQIQTTPNNPVSSRSHVIISLTYSNGINKRNLFICDLAGVENEFNCEDIKNTDYWRTLYETTEIIKKKDLLKRNSLGLAVTNPSSISSSLQQQSISPNNQSIMSSSSQQQSISPNNQSIMSSQPHSSAKAGPLVTLTTFGTKKYHNKNFEIPKQSINDQSNFIKKKTLECGSLSDIIQNNLIINEDQKNKLVNNIKNGFIIQNEEYPIGPYFNEVKEYIANGVSIPTDITEHIQTIITKLNTVVDNLSKINVGKFDIANGCTTSVNSENTKYTSKLTTPDENCNNYGYNPIQISFIDKFIEMMNELKHIFVLKNDTLFTDKYNKFKEAKTSFMYIVNLKIEKATKKNNVISDSNAQSYKTNIQKLIDQFEFNSASDTITKITNLFGTNKSDLKSVSTKSNFGNDLVKYAKKNEEILAPTVLHIDSPIKGNTLVITTVKDESIPKFNFSVKYDNEEFPKKITIIESLTGTTTEIDIVDDNYEFNNIQPFVIQYENNKKDEFIKEINNDINNASCFKFNTRYINGSNVRELVNTNLTKITNTFNIQINNDKLKQLFNMTFSDMTLANKLYKLRFPNSKLTVAPAPFLFYLKSTFLNEFDTEYNDSQLQVMFEQIRFYTTPYNDAELDKSHPHSSNGGGSLITHSPTKLPPSVSMENLSIPERSRRESVGIAQYGGGLDEKGMRSECYSRINEGKYINNFLKEMREGIAKYTVNIAKNKKKFPPFFTKCLPLQCNPEFKECLGIDDYNPLQVAVKDTTSDSYGELVDKIRELCEKDKKDNIVFCVFCVINFSEPPLVTEPPPVPYIDLTVLQQQYKKLENMVISKMNTDKQIKFIKNSVENVFNSVPVGKENLLNTVLNESREEVKTSNDTNQILRTVKTIISGISNINAATPIGTLLFTDSVAKNFIEVNTCNISSSYKTYALDNKKGQVVVGVSPNNVTKNTNGNPQNNPAPPNYFRGGESIKKNNKTRSTRTFLNRTISAKK